MINIYCLDDSEYHDFNSISRGCRFDIYIEYEKNYYQLNFFDTTRLVQDFEAEFNEYGYYNNMPNLIIVNEVSKKIILETIDNLIRSNYFEQIKPIDIIQIKDLELIKFSTKESGKN